MHIAVLYKGRDAAQSRPFAILYSTPRVSRGGGGNTKVKSPTSYHTQSVQINLLFSPHLPSTLTTDLSPSLPHHHHQSHPPNHPSFTTTAVTSHRHPSPSAPHTATSIPLLNTPQQPSTPSFNRPYETGSKFSTELGKGRLRSPIAYNIICCVERVGEV